MAVSPVWEGVGVRGEAAEACARGMPGASACFQGVTPWRAIAGAFR